MKQKHIYNLAALLLASSAAFISCSDNALDDPQPDGDRGASVVFNIKDIQQEGIYKNDAATRAGFAPAFYTPNLTQEDLVSQRLETESSENLDACIIETTVEGVNPTKSDETTRANVETAINYDFTSLGYRGETSGNIGDKPEWFYSKKTKKTGELYETHFWSWAKPYGRFYAIYPEVKAENNITLSPASHEGTPYIEFEVEQDVAKQKDLMTACSGVVHYDTQNTAPQTNLEFRHALTAVKFAVGQNLSWNKYIDYVEIRGAMSKGKYILSDKLDGDGAHWDETSLSTKKNFKLTPTAPGVRTTDNVNVVIMGKANDNYTFYMIPQELTNKNILLFIHFTDGTYIRTKLTGKWKPGTTKTYKISNKTSNWNYVLNVNSPAAVAYTGTQAAYSVQSYRNAPSGPTQPVKWEVVGYDADGDGNFTMEEKPDWLTGLSKTSGNGGTYFDAGTATLRPDIKDLLAERNKELKEATPKGEFGDAYNLSNPTGAASVENTANCYVVSAPGYYKIPLVYGNAIKNGATNLSAYYTSNSGSNILKNFVDHNNQIITNPWITLSNGGNNVPNGAKIVWADVAGIVTNQIISGSGNDAFLEFEVEENNIKHGNVLLAATKDGVIVWSWHIWITPANVLNTVTFTNAQNKQYKFTNENLGWRYTNWKGTTYSSPRTVKVKIQQEIPNGAGKPEAILTITQNNGGVREGATMIYQWGRKDPFPNWIATGSMYEYPHNGGQTYAYTIQNPSGYVQISNLTAHKWTWCNGLYYNVWSMNNTTTISNDNPVIKTVYDPCPVGFHVPASNAFTGFSKNGQNGGPINAKGEFNFGFDFYNKINNPDATLFFPAGGQREYYSTMSLGIEVLGSRGVYSTAIPASDIGNSYIMGFESYYINVLQGTTHARGFAVRPVADN